LKRNGECGRSRRWRFVHRLLVDAVHFVSARARDHLAPWLTSIDALHRVCPRGHPIRPHFHDRDDDDAVSNRSERSGPPASTMCIMEPTSAHSSTRFGEGELPSDRMPQLLWIPLPIPHWLLHVFITVTCIFLYVGQCAPAALQLASASA
jgi:hypothetical protein